MQVFIDGIGLCGPGLSGWKDGRAILAGEAPYQFAPSVIPVSALLPATERRRTVPTIKLALAVGAEALENAALDPAAIATVFSSSGGDGETVHAILEILASSGREVSPTKFHNSVHNAPAGYWSIATKAHAPSTSLCGYDESFAIGLIDAACQAITENRTVMLVAYDLPYPEPLHSLRPINSSFGVAFVLSPGATAQSLAAMTLKIKAARGRATAASSAELETLRTQNPSARSLPLLAALASGAPQTVTLDYLSGKQLAISLA